MRLTFSEKLDSIDQFAPLNVSSISNILFFDVEYTVKSNGAKKPLLLDWKITNFTNYEIVFKFNFTD